jgi:hypothetical protein
MKILKRSVREVYSKIEEVTIPFDTIAFTKIQKELEEAKQKVDRQAITIVTLEFKKKLKDDGIQKLHNLLTNRSFTYIGERGLISFKFILNQEAPLLEQLEQKFQKKLERAIKVFESQQKFQENLLTDEETEEKGLVKEFPQKFSELHCTRNTMSFAEIDLMTIYRIADYIQEKNSNPSMIPGFQRPSVWTREQKASLIKSILRGLPTGTYYINRSDNAELDDLLFDGQQRFTAIQEFLDGSFPVTLEGQEFYWYNLPPRELSQVENHLVQIVFTEFDSEEELVKFYIEMNENLSPHSKEEIQIASDYLKTLEK